MTLDLLCRCRQTECTDSSMVLLLASNKSKVLFLEPKKKRRLSRKQTEKGYKTEQARLFRSFQLQTYIHTSDHDHIQEKTLNHHSSHIPGFLSKPLSLLLQLLLLVVVIPGSSSNHIEQADSCSSTIHPSPSAKRFFFWQQEEEEEDALLRALRRRDPPNPKNTLIFSYVSRGFVAEILMMGVLGFCSADEKMNYRRRSSCHLPRDYNRSKAHWKILLGFSSSERLL